MSKQIDEKVVSMKFDNKDFEEKTSQTMSTLDKLKQKLGLPGASKGLDDVQKSADNVKLNPLSAAAEQVGVKFNALQVMATTALANITNSAVNAGKRMVAAFTIDPIKTGLQEYETQINAVQTILANTESKGTTLDDVNGALDQLNTYADKTIYNFTEMTRNIGTFTAAGVDLDTSVNAIQGIANLAAVSGSNSQQASTAMYQLSQALSSGTVKLQDWNSVVNAGMGGQVFQDALKETARVHGISIDDMIEKNGSFRETLQEGWLTSEILTETLQKFTLTTEGLTEEQIEANRQMLKSKGYTDEQIEGIFKLGNTATNAATKVKTFTQLLDTLKESAQSGWTQTWELIIGDFEEAKEMWTKVSDTLGKIIGDSAEARNSMLKGWADGGGREKAIEAIANAFKALVSVVTPIKEAFREIFPRTTSEQLLKITETIKDFTAKLILSEKAQEKLKSAFKGLFSVIDIGVTAIKEIVKGIVELLGNFTGLVKSVFDVSGSLGDFLSHIRDVIKDTGIFATVIGGIVKVVQKLFDVIKIVVSFLKEKFVVPGFEGFLNVLSSIWKVIKFIGEKIIQVLGTLGKGLLDAFRNGDFKAAMDVFNSGIIASILLNLKKFTSGFVGSLGSLKDVTEGVTGILDSVKGCFEAWQQSIKAKVLKTIATSIAILAVAILVIASIDQSKLTSSLGAVTVLFGELMASLAIFTNITKSVTGVAKATIAMVALSIAITILASALKKISGLDIKEIGVGLLGVFGLMQILMLALKSINNNVRKTAKVSGQLIAMAVAINLLSIAIKVLGGMELSSLAKGIGGVAVMLGVLVGALAIMSKFKTKGAGQLIAMAIALDLLAISIKVIGGMDLVNIAKGVGALVVVIYALVGAAAVMNGLIVGAAAMILLATSLLIFATALTMMIPTFVAFSLIDMGVVCGGLLKLAGTLAVLGIASMLAPMLLLLGSGLKALGAGLTKLCPGLIAITLLDFIGLCGSLLKFIGVMALFSIAAMISPLLLLLGASLTVLGVGALLAGPGLLALSAGMTAFAAALVGTGSIIINGITAIVVSIIGLIPSVIKAIGDGIILICKTIAGSVGAIAEAIAAIIVAVCNAIITALPKIVECAGKLLDALLKFIVEYAPKLVDAGMKLIIALLDGIAKNIGKVIEKAVLVVTKFLEGISSQIPKLISAAFDFILEFINGIADAIEKYTPLIMDACIDLGMSIIKGVVKGLVSLPGKIWDGIKSVGQSIIDGFCSFFGINSPAKEMIPIGSSLDEGMVVGLEKYKGLVINAAEDVGKDTVKTMSNAISGISDVVNTDIDSQPVIKPVLDLSEVTSGAGLINSMFGMTPSVDVLSNVGSINSMMNSNQNGGDSDILTAIKDLGATISGLSGNTYNVNGVTYDDGSNIASAVESIVRAARIERRI